MVNPVPQGYEGVTPYLIVDGAAAAIEFYRAVFGAVELFRIPADEGRIGHAELKIGQGIIMLADPFPALGAVPPVKGAGASVSFTFYTADVDALVARAVAAGAVVKSPVELKFYGDRMGALIDPFGHVWHVATHVEDVPPDELERRAAALGG